MALVVGADVLDAEPSRLLEVDLQCRAAPAASDGIAHVHVDLGCVKNAFTLRHHVRMPAASIAWRNATSASSQSAISPTNSSGRGRRLGLELVEPEVAQQLQHERQQAAQLGGELLGRAEDVRRPA